MPQHKPKPTEAEPQIDTTRKQHPTDAGAQGKLPHERDESVHMTDQHPAPEMQQAHRDVKKGLVNTDERASDGRPLGDDVPSP
jgi:hypothetical protein